MGSGEIKGAEEKLLKGCSFIVFLTIEPVNLQAKITATPVLKYRCSCNKSGFPRGWPTGSLIHA